VARHITSLLWRRRLERMVFEPGFTTSSGLAGTIRPKMLRRVGPLRGADCDLVTSVEKTAARKQVLPATAPFLLATSWTVILDRMSDVTHILCVIEQGDPHAAGQLLPLVYDELRKLAAQKLAQEKPGQTLQATALVHEAYLRLVDVEQAQHWNSRGHFFAAAAEAMRRILVDQARRKQADKRGGQGHRVPLEAADVGFTSPADALLDIDVALTRLAAEDPQAARLIQLRYFTGMSIEDAAEVVGISRSTAYEHWSYARVRLRILLGGE
jgi:RNA polymerase sigma factor (TIGR02999 family)